MPASCCWYGAHTLVRAPELIRVHAPAQAWTEALEAVFAQLPDVHHDDGMPMAERLVAHS